MLVAAMALWAQMALGASDVGTIEFPTTTRSAEAQAHFERGATAIEQVSDHGAEDTSMRIQHPPCFDHLIEIDGSGETIVTGRYEDEWNGGNPFTHAVRGRLGVLREVDNRSV